MHGRRVERCSWATTEPAITYHDKEWGVPVHNDGVLFEFLILEGAQAGLSWMTILKKRENYRKAFAGFRPEKIARYSERDVKRLLIPLAPLAQQIEIVGKIEAADTAVQAVQDAVHSSLQRASGLRSQILSEAFAGRAVRGGVGTRHEIAL